MSKEEKKIREISRERVFKEKGTHDKCKGPGTGECLACIQETARKLVNVNASVSILGHGGEDGKEKACIKMTQDQGNLNK